MMFMWVERLFSNGFPEPATLAILSAGLFVMFGLFGKNQRRRIS
jgi:hypothetical protein